jgi:hypothetical protein
MANASSRQVTAPQEPRHPEKGFWEEVGEHAKEIGLSLVVILGHLLLAVVIVLAIWAFEHYLHLFVWAENTEHHLFGVIPLSFAFDTADGFVILGVGIKAFKKLSGVWS